MMAFRTDNGGFAFKANDAKIQHSSWGNRLSQLHKQKGTVRIITYSLPDMAYVRRQLGRRPHDIYIIAHSKFSRRANEICGEFPGIVVAVHDEVHSKVVLVEPETVIVSSANFGDSGWHETTVSFHSKPAHEYYRDRVWEPLFGKCWLPENAIPLQYRMR